MSDIQFQRAHSLGLLRAREVALVWVAQAKERWGLDFEQQPWTGEATAAEAVDRIQFRGMGARGEVQVTATDMRVQLKLFGLMKGFAAKAEEKMSAKLDTLLAEAHRGEQAA